jgi:putative FmdB family regulatory protein
MPIYEYRCTECGHQLEALQKISDEPLTACPACEKSALRKQLSAPAFRLSGSGWYETDFKSDKEKRRNLAGSDSSGGAEKSDKSESKPDKTDTKTQTAEKPKTDKAASTAKAG